MTEGISRRLTIGAFLASATAANHLVGRDAQAADSGTSAAQHPPGQCVLLPQAVEGPFYFDPKLVRADIAEGRPGASLKLNLRFVESGPCLPLSNLRVDIWHADAGGTYSGYAGQGPERSVSTKGQTYLRGTQMTDENGSVTFASIYPGWYPGRTPHIHIKAFLDAKTLVTGQVFFPDDVSQRIYSTRMPYKDRPMPDTTNATDGIFRDGQREGGGTVLAVGEEGDTITAALLISVDKSGSAAANARGFLRRILGL